VRPDPLPPQPDALRALAGDLRTDLLKTLGDDATVQVGVGPVVASIGQAHQSYACAQDAARVAANVPGFAAVAAWADLGIYSLLVQLPIEQLRDKALPAGLRKLFEADTSGMLIETLEIYLDEAGRPLSAIERLQVHRTTLYYRLNRIEQLTGARLDSGSDRLALHLGLKVARLIGALPVQQ
jgi:sugar diacid utilization regulator